MNYNLIDDTLCIPMLQFFNDYLNMPTKFCCQGHPDRDKMHHFYIIFDNAVDEHTIEKFVNDFYPVYGRVCKEYHCDGYLFSYTLDSWDAKKNQKLALMDLIIMKMRYHHNTKQVCNINVFDYYNLPKINYFIKDLQYHADMLGIYSEELLYTLSGSLDNLVKDLKFIYYTTGHKNEWDSFNSL